MKALGCAFLGSNKALTAKKSQEVYCPILCTTKKPTGELAIQGLNLAMATVGFLARFDLDLCEQIRLAIEAMSGVKMTEMSDPQSVSIWVDAETVDQAYATVRDDIESLDGLHDLRPIYASFGQFGLAS